MRDELIGKTLLDQYRVIKALGAGGMGRVFLAEQPSLGRYAAVKIVRASGLAQSENRERFQREARTVSRLNHPNIVTVYNYGELVDGTMLLAMEYIEGVSLATLLGGKPLPVLRALNLCYQCAAALGHAHANGVVHRDLKPANVMVTRLIGRDHVKILDFGIALLLGESTLTHPGTIVGTPEFMSPEHCRGETVTSFSDQYALGLMLYQMLTGKHPYTVSHPLGYLHQHQHEKPLPPSRVSSDAALRGLDEMVLRMLAKTPQDRFGSMSEIQAALDRAIEGVLVGKPQVSAPAGAPTLSSPAARPLEPRSERVLSAPQTTRAMLLDPQRLTGKDKWDELRRMDIRVEPASEWTDCLVNRQTMAAPTVWVISEGVERSRGRLARLLNMGLPAESVLLCLDEDPGSDRVQEVLGLASNVIIGEQPLELEVLAVALKWLSVRRGAAIDLMSSTQPVQVCQLASAKSRSVYVDALAADLREQGVRRPVQEAIREVAEEMISNAWLHGRPGAPPDAETAPLLDPAADRNLPAMRWMLDEKYVVLSVRDRHGLLLPADVLRHATGAVVRRPTGADGSFGGGLGLRMMARSAGHLFFFIRWGQFCEALALIPRHPRKRGRPSLSFFFDDMPDERPIGQALYVSVRSRAGETEARLRGFIDESASLQTLFAGAGRLHLDLASVYGINSQGLRSWLNALEGRSAELQLIYERCAPAVVRQLAMLPELSQGVEIRSVIAPYVCTGCEKEYLELVPTEALPAMDTTAAGKPCLACGGELELDELPSTYFAFARPPKG